jgi:hypothetical protein
MCTNTSRVMTCFSDLRHQAGVPTYPHNREVLNYLRRYVDKFDLAANIRSLTRVESIEQTSDGKFLLRSTLAGEQPQTELFDRVVIAAGRYNHPMIPHVNGIDSFRGPGGVCHTFRYKDPTKYRDMRVLVAGCSISALEIASDLAMIGAREVVATFRKQRYVIPKLVGGVPVDHIAFTRWSGQAAEEFPREAMNTGLKAFIQRVMGFPHHYGAQAADEDIATAGLSLSQYFLPLVAEGRITTKPWIEKIDAEQVTFNDGTTKPFDAIIFATGYTLSMPYLSASLRDTLAADPNHIHLDRFVFHPSVPGMAFMGMYQQIGPYFSVLELQARLIAYTWAGVIAQASETEMISRIAALRAQNPVPTYQIIDAMALMFSRAIGTEPDVDDYPDLRRALMFGPLSATSFRISGPDALPNGSELFAEDAAAFGATTSPEFTPEQREQLTALRNAQRDRMASTGVSPAA